MKKILLTLMALLLFAPPEAFAETKTVTFLKNPKTNSGYTDDFYVWAYLVNGGEYNLEDGLKTGYYGSIGSSPNADQKKHLNPGMIKAGEILMKFTGYDMTSKPSNSEYVKALSGNLEFRLGGFNFTFTTTDPSKYNITKIEFKQPSNYHYGASNFSNFGGITNPDDIIACYDETTYIQTWQSSKGQPEVTFAFKHAHSGETYKSCINANTGSAMNLNYQYLYHAEAITVTYESAAEPPSAPIIAKGSLGAEDMAGTQLFHDFSSPLPFRLLGGQNDPGTTSYYYKIVPPGETLTSIPAADEEGVVMTTSGSDLAMIRPGRIYAWAASASDYSLCSQMVCAEVKAYTTLISALNASEFRYATTDNEDTPDKWPTISNLSEMTNTIDNIKSIMVPIPDSYDYLIIEFDNSTTLPDVATSARLGAAGLYVFRNTGFSIKTLSRSGTIERVEMSASRTVDAKAFSNLQFKPLNFSEEGYNTPFSRGTYTATLNISKNPRRQVDFYCGDTDASNNFLFVCLNKILVGANAGPIESPAAPEIEMNGAYTLKRGVYTFINKLDFRLYDPNKEYTEVYWSTVDENSIANAPDYDHSNKALNEISGSIDATHSNPGKFLARARRSLSDGTFYESPVQSFYYEVQPATEFATLSEIVKETNTGREFLAIPASPMTITGVYPTRLDNGSQLYTYYAYLTDARGAAIKMVCETNDPTKSPFPADFVAGAVIPAGGFTGSFRFNYGSPEIVVTDYTSYFKPTTAGTAPLPKETTTISTSSAGGAIPDFNKKIILRHARYIGNSTVQIGEGDNAQNILVYSRLRATDNPGGLIEAMTNSSVGSLWAIEGYVGQVRGATAIFPTAPVRSCPDTPVLLAPNPISGSVNAISDAISVSIADTDNNYAYYYNSTPDAATATLLPQGESIALTKSTTPTELYVFAKSGDLFSVEPAHVTITWHESTPVGSIAGFKEEFIPQEASLPLALSNDNPTFTAQPGSYRKFMENGDATHEVVIVERTPEWLYVRDNLGDNYPYTSANYLLIHNDNEWANPTVTPEDGTERELAVGDIINGFALVPAKTSRGNLVSESTGFARTVRYVSTTPGFTPVFAPIEVGYVTDENDNYFTNIHLGDAERMRLVELRNVRIRRSDTPDENGEYTYTLLIGTPGVDPEVTLAFDIFEQSVNGFRMAYDPGSPDENYTIKGIFIRNNRERDEAYAIALIDFSLQKGQIESPRMFVAGTTDPATQNAAEQTFDRTLKVDIELPVVNGKTASAFYTIDGSDPLNSPESRIAYPGHPVEIPLPEDADRIVVQAVAYMPGWKPSATVTRTFVNSTRSVPYLLNFINQGVQGTIYNFTGYVKIAAVADNWMMVRGSVGHYLPIYNPDGWDKTTYTAGAYLTGFMMAYDKDKGNIRGVASASHTFPAPVAKPDDMQPIDVEPDVVTFITKDNARRFVRLQNAQVNTVASTSDPSASIWTVTGTDHGSSSHPLVLSHFGTPLGDPLRDGGVFDIEGYVMLDAAGNAELWPTSASEIKQTNRVSVAINGVKLNPVSNDATSREYEAEFEKGAIVTLTTDNDKRDNTVIYYSYDNEKWYTYSGDPFIVLESQNQIHAYARNENERASAHTHIKLTKVGSETTDPSKVSGKVKFSLTESDDHSAMIVTMMPDGNVSGASSIYYIENPTGAETAEDWNLYTGPLTITTGCRIMAVLVEDGKLPGEPSDVTVWLIPTGIDGVDADRSEDTVRAEGSDIIAPAGSQVFDINGRRVSSTGLRSGIYIVRTPAGKAVKIRI